MCPLDLATSKGGTKLNMSNFFRRLAQTSFFFGFARGIDLLGSLSQPMPYRRGEDSADADARAIASDWTNVGADMGEAVNQMAREHQPVS